MANCDNLITNQDLENAKQNADTYKVVIESDLPTTTTPDGKTIFTLTGLSQQITFIYPPILWEPGLTVDNALQLYEVPPSVSGDTGSFLVFPFVENLPFVTGPTYDPSKWTVLQYSKENLDQAVADAEAQAQAAAISASQAADSAQLASDEADRAEQAAIDATLNSGVYETVADGIAATSNGDLFNVISQFDFGFVDLYLNDSGVGVYQNKTSLDKNYADTSVLFGTRVRTKNAIPFDVNFRSQFTSSGNTPIWLEPDPDEDIFFDQANINGFWETSARRIDSGSQGLGNIAGQNCMLGYFTTNQPPSGILSNTIWAVDVDTDTATQITTVDDVTVQLAPNVWLKYLTGVVPAVGTNIKLYIQVGAGAAGWKAGGPGIFTSTSTINWWECDWVNQLYNPSQRKLPDVSLVEDTKDLRTTTYPPAWDTETTLEPVTDIQPDGKAIIIPSGQSNTTNIMEFKFTGDQQDQYYHVDYHVYAPSLEIAQIRPSVQIVDGVSATTVSPLDLYATQLESGVYKISVVGQFGTNTTDYGIRVANFVGFPDFAQDVIVFGYTAAVRSEPYFLHAVQPVVFIPKVGTTNSFTLAPDNYDRFIGKRLLYIGHSIPAWNEYPEVAAAELGMEITNISLAGRFAMAFTQGGAWRQSNEVNQCLTLTKQEIQDRYSPNIGQEVNPNDYFVLQPGSGFVLTQPDIDALKTDNYETLITEVIGDYDYFIIQLGMNDRNLQTDPNVQWTLAKDAGLARDEFSGAINYLYNEMFIAKQALGQELFCYFVSNYERNDNQLDRFYLYEAQRDVAGFLGLTFIDAAANLQVNQYTRDTLISPDGIHPVTNGQVSDEYARQIVGTLRRL